MNTSINKYNILFLDIETVSVKASFNELSKSFQNLWAKKHQSIVKDAEISFEESFADKAAIYAEFGKIVCISCGYLAKEDDSDKLRIKSFYGNDEKQILNQFAEMLTKNYSDTQSQTLCGHNIKEFDIPYLCRRMLVNGIELPEILSINGKKPWEVNFIDTLQLWKFGDYKAYTSLNLLATLFEIPTPKDDIDGSMVSSVYWKENDLKRITTYCQKDVITTVRVLQKMINSDWIKDSKVEFVS